MAQIHLILAAFIVVIDSVSSVSIFQLCYFQNMPVHVIHVSFISNLWFLELLQLWKSYHPPVANFASAVKYFQIVNLVLPPSL